MTWNDENLAAPVPQGWWHAAISFPRPAGVTPEAATALATALASQRFHFLRKDGGLRLRTSQRAAGLLDELVASGLASRWTGGIYEPETHAFGGPAGIAIAHEVFCADSPAALAETGSPGARERAILLISALTRAACLDPFETGDVWAKIADLRPPVEPLDPARRAAAVTAMRRLLNADAAQCDTTEPGWPQRVAAFEEAGRQLARLAAAGQLTRGLRAILAHHAIFVFNRAGVQPASQAAAAWLAKEAAFADDGMGGVFIGRPGTADPNLNRMETVITTTTDPAGLRAAMVNSLISGGHLRTTEIISAFAETERHRFLPGADLQAAYANDAVPIKHDGGGEMISCISAPSIVATQLEQLDVRPGHKVLEAGAATGYNAALLSRLTGTSGRVWTIDVDQDLVNGAAEHLAAAGASNATVVLGDGAVGLPGNAPYDRIQFTVGAGDIPVQILDQLAPGGRLVIPMRIRGSISRSFAFERDGATWKTVSCEMATFVPLRKSSGDDTYLLIPMAGEGNVCLETFQEQEVDREALSTVLDQDSSKIYTGVKFRQGAPWQWVYLWLACVLDNGLSRLPGQRPGFTPHFAWGSMAALDGSSLAYLTVREGNDNEGRFWEIGVIGHGPSGASLVGDVADAIREWARDYGNDAPEPGFRMAPAADRDLLKAADPRFIIDKPASRLVVDWP
jgi:protein-L-isoaspartate(D-aspartate) O-methyltransferase